MASGSEMVTILEKLLLWLIIQRKTFNVVIISITVNRFAFYINCQINGFIEIL